MVAARDNANEHNEATIDLAAASAALSQDAWSNIASLAMDTTFSAQTSGDSADFLVFNDIYGNSGGDSATTNGGTKSDDVTMDTFSEESLKMFKELDADGNGFITKAELAFTLQDQAVKGKDAQIVGAMYKQFDNLVGLSTDFEILESGITKNDLAEFDKAAQLTKVQNWFCTNDKFAQLDADGNKFLSMKEIESALAIASQPLEDEIESAIQTRELDKANLEFLKQNYDVLQGNVNDPGFDSNGVSKADVGVKRYVAEPVESTLKAAADLHQNGTLELYKDSDDPLSSITPDAINQGPLGDCYLEAALASIAATEPELIRDMIKENGDGTFTVTFNGDRDNPVTVKGPTEAEMVNFNNSENHGSWANVIEKAFGEYSRQSVTRRSIANHAITGVGHTPTEGADGGEMMLGSAMSLLTGRERDVNSLRLTWESTLRSKMSDAFADGDNRGPVIASIMNWTWNAKNSDGLTDGHAYAVTNFDKATDTVTVMNPYGRGSGPDGTMTMSLAEFHRKFSVVTFSGAKN